MAALSLAFVVIDRDAGLNLILWKCCWVQYGGDSCHELLDWVSVNCEAFREMKIVKFAKIRWHNDWTRGLLPPMNSTAE